MAETIPALNKLLFDYPEQEYHKDRTSISNSWLKQCHPTPAHLKAYLDADDEPTAAQLTSRLEGKVIHTMLLEPHEFDNRYVVGPDVNKNTNVWKAAKADAIKQGKEIIDVKLHAKAAAIHRAVYAKPNIARLLEARTEVSGFWRETTDDYDALCKFRADLLPTHGSIPDLKTTQIEGGASPEGFGKILWNMMYPMQSAHYLKGLEACGYDINWKSPWWWIVVEMNPPYQSNVFVLTRDLLDHFAEIRRQRMTTISECLTTGNWPGYDDDPKAPILPAWAQRQIEN